MDLTINFTLTRWRLPMALVDIPTSTATIVKVNCKVLLIVSIIVSTMTLIGLIKQPPAGTTRASRAFIARVRYLTTFLFDVRRCSRRLPPFLVAWVLLSCSALHGNQAGREGRTTLLVLSSRYCTGGS